jgi:hypothetical protein
MNTWGCPWHGLIKSGQIALPNGQNKSFPQPARMRQNQWDENGFTCPVRVPGVAAVSRTPEELTDDQARGWEWRNDAVLAGAYLQLHGTPLGGWIYCAPSGDRWLVSPVNIANPVNTESALTLELRISRFGVVGGTPDERTRFASLANLGQAEPDPANPSPAGSPAWLSISDVKPDGSAALLMIYKPVYAFDSNGSHPLNKIPLGWLELTMSEVDGEVTGALSVVRTRAQAYGAATWDNGTPGYQWNRVRPTPDVTSVTGDGYTDYTTTPRPLAETGSGTGVTAWVYDKQQSRQLTGRIVAMWYAETGYDVVTLDMQQTYQETAAPPTETTSGSKVERHYTNGTIEVLSDTMVQRLSWNGTASMQSSLALRLNGTEIDSTSTSGDLSQSKTAGWFGGGYPSQSQTKSETVEGITTASSSTGTGDGQPNFGPLSSFSALCVPYDKPWDAAYYLYGWDLFSSNNWVQLEICRQSNTLIGFERNKPLAGTRSWGPISSRAGKVAGTVSPAGLARYGSENPNTGAITRNQTTPVCHV